VTFLLQATTTIEDFQRLEDGLAWLKDEVGHTDGLVSLRIFRAQDDPTRVTMLEEWKDADAFARSFAAYSVEQRGQFLARLGLTAEQFERGFWVEADLVVEL
jgi:quinol monooxygenase YgiN